uniref:Annexin D3 n=1 Tax=Rhizophora mucronata TaxID=61149 RepID=A0A2P2KDS2_RHIMU
MRFFLVFSASFASLASLSAGSYVHKSTAFPKSPNSSEWRRSTRDLS